MSAELGLGREMEKYLRDVAEPVDATEAAEFIDPLVEAFDQAGFPLNAELVEMLKEGQEHRWGPTAKTGANNNRKGSGFTQASRFIAEKIPRLATGRVQVLNEIFDIEKIRQAWIAKKLNEKKLSGEAADEFDVVEEFKISSVLDFEIIDLAVETLPAGHKLVGRMILDMIKPAKSETAPGRDILPIFRDEKRVGTCTTAELYFLQAAYFDDSARQRYVKSNMNVVVGLNGSPLVLEKMMGDQHSGLLLQEAVLEGVRLPPGSLVFVDYPIEKNGRTISVNNCTGFSFLRLTPFAVSPENRRKTFGMIVAFEEYNSMPNPRGAKIEDFVKIAEQIMILDGQIPSNLTIGQIFSRIFEP